LNNNNRAHNGGATMEKENDKMVSYLRDEEVKIVWSEDDKTKVGRGKIVNDDDNFVYLSGSKGNVIVSKTDIIAIKQ
jgi:RNase P/RNase MRP subunit p29